MTGLTELLEEAANRPAPPSQLNADTVYRAGRRRLRRRRALLSTVVLSLVAVMIGGTTTVGRGGLAEFGGSEPAPDPTSIMSVGFVNPLEIYVLRSTCPVTTPATGMCSTELLVSTHEGRDWRSRGPTPGTGPMIVAGPESLILQAAPPLAGQQITFDGGRTWQAMGFSVESITAGEPGMRVVSWPTSLSPDLGMFFVANRATHDLRPLAGVPLLAGGRFYQNLADRIFYAGADPLTGAPTVAISYNSGRFWKTVTLPGPTGTAIGSDASRFLQVVTADGLRAYALYRDGRHPLTIWRTDDAGATWTLVESPPAIVGNDVGAAFVTASGALAIQVPTTGQSGLRWLISDDGRLFRSADLVGLPIGATPEAMDHAGFIAHDNTGVYLSVTGLNWRRVVPR